MPISICRLARVAAALSPVLFPRFSPVAPLDAQAPRAAPATTDVPVAKVVLFSSGVGYFEHAGMVHGNGATELRFKTSQINDILKSIMLQDQDGGRVGAITYPSQDPLAKTLKSFQVDIAQNPSLADLLNQLRGARVTIQAQAEHLSGTILGVESRRKPGDASGPLVVPVLNLLSGANIRSVELPSISNLSLDDPQLQDELTKALSALVQARDQDRKPVTIDFSGVGDRRVRIGYVVETPVWKTSYRLLLGEKGSSGNLQGWAIVENQTESDWNNVSLALVSGRPISFMMDLYQPLYSTRPTVVPELFAGLRPQVYDAGTGAERERVSMLPSGAPSPAAMPAAQRRIGYGPDGRPVAIQLSQVVTTSTGSEEMNMSESVRSVAQAAKLGELFQYTVSNVTLPRQKSAMLPIITDSVETERVSIYNASVLRTNPLNGVWLKNTTGKNFLQGPVTVLDKGGYAGDARIDDVPPGQKRLLSYGIDLDMTVNDARATQTVSISAVRVSKGMLFSTRRLVSTQEYAADNKTTHDKMLVIEHPVRQGWTLIQTQNPAEATPAVYRFKGIATANKVTTLVVKEEMVEKQSVGLVGGLDYAPLLTYSQNREFSQQIRDAFAKAVQLWRAVSEIEQQITPRTQQISDITAEQGRLRENLKTVPATGPYYERLLAKLNEQESTIERLQAERAALIARRQTLRRELDEYLVGLEIS